MQKAYFVGHFMKVFIKAAVHVAEVLPRICTEPISAAT